VAGLFDVAQSKFKLKPQEKDIGQTLGKYGIGEGFYIVWPFLGPSDARDTIGTASDLYLSPWIKVRPAWIAGTLGGIEYFNKASFDGAEYEELVNSAIEPYAALKNAYIQYRRNIVKEN
jgi:phospholipid-binding lipoprotein MlaA